MADPASLIANARKRRAEEATEQAQRPDLEAKTCSDASVRFMVPDTKKKGLL